MYSPAVSLVRCHLSFRVDLYVVKIKRTALLDKGRGFGFTIVLMHVLDGQR